MSVRLTDWPRLKRLIASFTMEDVTWLREEADWHQGEYETRGGGGPSPIAQRYRHLADRLESLIPPWAE